MKLVKAFFRLVRLPNLVFIMLTQVLFQFCIYYPIYREILPNGDFFRFGMLVLASVLIAAAGYIINDYFDINIDLVNKPGKMVVGKQMGRRTALVWHLALSILGIVFTFFGIQYGKNGYLVAANAISVLLLWFYSARLKKDLLIGNIIVSLLTAWTILIIFLSKYSLKDAFGSGDEMQLKLFRFAFLYTGFAFIATLIREAIKDIEDLPGDMRYGCRTMPAVWGVIATKVYIAVWLTILIILVSVVQFYLLQLGWWAAVIYGLIFMLLPALNLFRKLLKAESIADYHHLSSLTKWLMLGGILSMIFFYFYL